MQKDRIVVKTSNLDDNAFANAIFNNKKLKIVGALDNELIEAQIYGKKKKYFLAEAVKILKANKYRIKNKDESYRANSPFQIADYEYEKNFKKNLIIDYFKKLANIYINPFKINEPKKINNYRNKIEYNFFKDENGIYFALSYKGSFKKKFPIKNSILADEKINIAGEKFLHILNKYKEEKEKLIVIRKAKDKIFAKLYVTEHRKYHEKLVRDLQENKIFDAFSIQLSPQNSPAAISFETLYSYGNFILKEKVLDKEFEFEFEHFFQVNIDEFEEVIKDIRKYLKNKKYKKAFDVFSGIGTIGILLHKFYEEITFLEISDNSEKYALLNAANNNIKNAKAIKIDANKINLDNASDSLIIVDPPRAGLQKFVNTLAESNAKTIIYMSCNPKTQVMDTNILKHKYKIAFAKSYNFFPRTSHIENLIILERNI